MHKLCYATFNVCCISQDPSAVLSEQRSVQNEQDFTAVDVSCNFYDYTLVTNNNL